MAARSTCPYKRYALVVLVLGLLGACGLTDKTATPLPPEQATSSPLPSYVPPEVGSLVPGQPPAYREIIVGTSRKEDVLEQWGPPNTVRTWEAYESLHYFTYRSGHHVDEYFLVQDGVVLAVTSNDPASWIRHGDHPASFEDLEVLGEPEVIVPILESSFPIWVFPDHGLAVGHVSGGRIYTYQVFVPMSAQAYQAVWGQYDLGIAPFPLIPSVEEVGIQPGQTSEEEVRQLLGPPDLIDDEGRVSWLYYIEPDTLGRLSIFFDSRKVVTSMDIDMIRREDIRWKEIVEQYGVPDAVRLDPGFLEGRGYSFQSLVYSSRGLVVTANCPTLACDVLYEDTQIIAKIYTEPKTLQEYREKCPQSVFMEWHGFDR